MSTPSTVAPVQEFQDLPIGVIHPWSDNPRQTQSEAGLEELTASVLRHGVLQPILVRQLNGKAKGQFLCIAGARRLSAAKAAGLAMVPVRVLTLGEEAAEEVAIIENLQREDMTPLDEGRSYQRLLDAGRSIDDVAAAVGKSKPYIYQRLSLLRLGAHATDLLERDVLPLSYALKLATLPEDKQGPAIQECFRPMYHSSGEALQREWLEPIGRLQAWIDKHAKLEPHSEDVQVLLPELAAQLEAATATEDGGQAPSVLALSSLHFHTDKSDPRPILVNSWKRAEGSKACKHAQPGVIVLGDGRGTLLQVCVAKKACGKHWPKKKTVARATKSARDAEIDRWNAQQQKNREALEAWRTVRKGAALRLAHAQLADILWDPRILELLFEDLGHYSDIEALVGTVSHLANHPEEIPRAVALLLLHGRAYSEGECIAYAKRLGLTLGSKDITAATGAAADKPLVATTRKARR